MRAFIPVLLVSCVPATPDGLTDEVDCASAPEVGTAGARVIEQVPLTWTQADGLWVSQTVRLRVPDDIAGLALTVDGGPARTAVLQVDLDGASVFDARGRGRKARVDGPFDSFFDSFWDTVDSGADTGWDGGGSGFPGFGVTPYVHLPGFGATLQWPMNADTRPVGGCVQVVAAAVEDPGGTGTLHVGSRRSLDDGVLDVDVVVLEGAELDDAELSAVLGVVYEVYRAAGGPALGTVQRFSLDAGNPRPRLQDLPRLRAATLPGGTEGATHVIVAAGFEGSPGTLGLAAGIPGPPGIAGTGASGVSLNLGAHRDEAGTLDLRLLGETLAHELGHQLGLFHTTESGGDDFDVISDTPQCPAASFDADRDGTVTAEECEGIDGRNLMFWVAGSFSQDQLSPEQVDVLRRSPANRRTP